MFNRTVELKLVKKSKKNADQADTEQELDESKILNIMRTGVAGTGMVAVQVLACYMALDTARKVVVNRLSK